MYIKEFSWRSIATQILIEGDAASERLPVVEFDDSWKSSYYDTVAGYCQPIISFTLHSTTSNIYIVKLINYRPHLLNTRRDSVRDETIPSCAGLHIGPRIIFTCLWPTKLLIN